MSQMNIPVSAHADNLERDSHETLEMLAAIHSKLDNGELCEADLAAWKNPRVALCNFEMAIRMLDLIDSLQSHVKELREQNRELRENVALINEVLFNSLDDDADEDQEAAVPSAATSSVDMIH